MKVIKEQVFSKIEDKNIKNDVSNSPIWKECKHLEDAKEGEKGFVYTILFEGPKPIQVTSVKQHK